MGDGLAIASFLLTVIALACLKSIKKDLELLKEEVVKLKGDSEEQ